MELRKPWPSRIYPPDTLVRFLLARSLQTEIMLPQSVDALLRLLNPLRGER